MHRLSPFVAALALCAATPALANTTAKAEAEPGVNSVNLSPLGLAFGSYALNYERLFKGGHGLLIEGGVSVREKSDGANSTAFGGLVGYRHHFSGKQQSWFAGASLGVFSGSGESKVKTTVGGATVSTKTFDVDHTLLAVTANGGYRWAWDFGLNITIRLGAGYGRYSFDTASSDPDAQKAVDEVEDLLTSIPLAVDGELSLGWIF